MVTYTFYLNGDFYVVMGTTYEGACRAFRADHGKTALEAATIVSIRKTAA